MKKTEIFMITGLVFLCLFLIIFPFLYCLKFICPIDLNEYGNLGDFIGGITAPAIGIIASYLVYKSFVSQREANDNQFRVIRDQKEYDMLFEIYKEFKQESSEIDLLLSAKAQTLRYQLKNELGLGLAYTHEVSTMVEKLNSLHFHIWSFHQPIINRYGNKNFGDEIEEGEFFILIHKFLNVYKSDVESIYDQISKLDPSYSSGQVLKRNIDLSIDEIRELNDLVVTKSKPKRF